MHIFYCTDGKFGEEVGVFLAKKHSSDACVGSIRRWTRASDVLLVSDVA